MTQLEKVPMILNVDYGGYSFSDEAVELYMEKFKLLNPNSNNTINNVFKYNGRLIKRTDPIMIEVVRELGEKANGKHAHLEIIEVYKEYVDYVTINEYDGKESIDYQIETYKLNKIKNIISESLSSDEKILMIQELVNRDLYSELIGLD